VQRAASLAQPLAISRAAAPPVPHRAAAGDGKLTAHNDWIVTCRRLHRRLLNSVWEAPMTEPSAERRNEPRLRCLLTGLVVFEAHQSTMDCAVRSISAHGARIVLPDAFRVPDEFDLAIPHHEAMHHAQVTWRKGESLGLALSDVAEHVASARHKMTPRQKQRARLKAMAATCYG
jgi:hypothetical protein